MSRIFFFSNPHEKPETQMPRPFFLLGMPRKLGLLDGFYASRAEWAIHKSLPSQASLLKRNAVVCYVTVCFSDVAMVCI